MCDHLCPSVIDGQYQFFAAYVRLSQDVRYHLPYGLLHICYMEEMASVELPTFLSMIQDTCQMI